ncbi:MAG: nitroreductase family protein [Hyphomonadaceae bacterium]|nr:nitroreductase family protein [Hyphomonadaceae bacterium]
MATRRHVLQLLAGAAAAPGLASCASGPDPAAAWRAPGAAEADIRRYALAHAILAPNPHNRQPWLVDLDGADGLTLSIDRERLLPVTDPFERQITIGCGAFLELLALAAGARGYATEMAVFPNGEPQPRLDDRPIAQVRFVPGAAQADPLFAHVLARRTSREAYEARVPAQSDLRAIAEAASGPGLTFGWADGGELRETLRTLAWDAFETEMTTRDAYMESVDLMRIGAAEIARHRDGLVLDGPMIEIARTLGLVNRSVLADLSNPLTRSGIDAFKPLALEAPAFLWLRSDDNSRATQIAAGRAYARANLAATARGLSMHPWSQSLQEYPEQARYMEQAERLMDAPGEARVQMFVRIGYGPRIGPSPRRGLEEHVRA